MNGRVEKKEKEEDQKSNKESKPRGKRMGRSRVDQI